MQIRNSLSRGVRQTTRSKSSRRPCHDFCQNRQNRKPHEQRARKAKTETRAPSLPDRKPADSQANQRIQNPPPRIKRAGFFAKAERNATIGDTRRMAIKGSSVNSRQITHPATTPCATAIHEEIAISDEPDHTVNITFGGNNTHTGGIYINNSNTATFTHDNAVGMGELGFGGSSGGTANFETANPVIHGLSADDNSAQINLNYSGNRIFTINQAEETRFSGDIDGSEASTIVKEGAGMFLFDSGTIYSSGISDGQGSDVALEIKDGTFFFGQNATLSSGGIKVNGGTHAVQGGTYLNNDVVVTSGRIAGYGTYSSSISIGAGAMLSPGLDGHGLTGALEFSHLELDSGGVYEFHVQDPNPENHNGRDQVRITDPKTLVINATSLDPFIIKIISLDTNGEAGQLSGIDMGHGLYSWSLFDYTSLSIPGTSNVFNSNLFSLDFSEFTSDALYGGDFSLFQDTISLCSDLHRSPSLPPTR